jgi:hypothetical protein
MGQFGRIWTIQRRDSTRAGHKLIPMLIMKYPDCSFDSDGYHEAQVRLMEYAG